jgi:hypothetical protein
MALNVITHQEIAIGHYSILRRPGIIDVIN